MRGNRINPVAWVGLHKGLHTSMVLLLVCSISGSFICKNEAKLVYQVGMRSCATSPDRLSIRFYIKLNSEYAEMALLFQ